MTTEAENYQGVHKISDLGIIRQAGVKLDIPVKVLARPGQRARFRANIMVAVGIVIPEHTEIITRGNVLIEVQNKGEPLGNFWDKVNDLRIIPFPQR